MPVVAKVYKDANKMDLIVDKRPNAASSESIRTLRTNLQFSSVDEELKTLLITSTLPGEGKSFISANLATSFAEAGKKVLLIDCDLRKGRQHKIFKLVNKKGLSNLLIENIYNFKDYIMSTKIDNLSVITRGSVPPNPSELLNSKKNKELLKQLREKFDLVILDGAPITGLSDSLILSSLTDKTLVITSINNTPKTDLANTKKALEGVGANIAGCVANNINAKNKSYGNYYYYNDYYYSEKSSKK
jgi:capsular exopolysaccharide synthesis family protein